MKKFFKLAYIGEVVIPTIVAILLLSTVFTAATFLWIVISEYKVNEFFSVMQLILKNMGVYSTLLVGIIVSFFYNSYNAFKANDKVIEEKIKSIGHYMMAFSLNPNSLKGLSLPVVNILNDESDNFKEYGKTCIVPIKFLTSKDKSSNLKNVMAFSDNYFKNNKKAIIHDYYTYCMNITESNPIYCAAKPTCELINNDDANRQRYFYLVNNNYKENNYDYIWISAITEEGTLMFIHLKYKNQTYSKDEGVGMTLIQQTTYFAYKKDICPLYIDKF
ncbi:MAG: hypothetical protein K0S41_1254 [Anaerocolumna sp.]|jgi:hypothetical protein|nr:hypothetical protein [Anaerocolumna sp.]